MDKPLAMGRDNRPRAEATIGHPRTRKAPPFDHHLSPTFNIPATVESTHWWTFINQLQQSKSSFNLDTAREIGLTILNKTCYDIQQLNTLLIYIFFLWNN